MKLKTFVFRTPALLVFAWMIFFGLSIRPVQAAPAAQTPGLDIRMSLVNEERSAFPGQYLEFEIIVENTSNTTQSNVQITNQYTKESLDINFVEVYSGEELLDIEPTYGQNNFTIDLGDMPPNAEYSIIFWSLVKDLNALNKSNITVIENTANLSVNGTPGEESKVSLDVVAFSIEKGALGDGVIQAGEPTEMVLRVVNNTDVNFEQVEVDDYYELPSSFTNTLDQTNQKGVAIRSITFDSTETAQAPIMQDATGNDYVLWQLGQMNAGETVEIYYTIEFELRPQATDEKLLNRAYVWGNDGEVFPLMAQTDFPAELLLEDPPPQIAMKRSIQRLPVAGEIRLGDRVQFTIEIVNAGGPAANVVISDGFDGNVFAEDSFVLPSKDNGRRDGSSRIIWEIGNLASGDTRTVSYEVKLKEGLFAGNQVVGEEVELTHTASILIDGSPQETTANETFTVRKLLKLNDISIDDVNGADIEPGDTLKVTIPIENKGETNASDIRVLVDYDLIEKLSFDNLGQGQLDQTKGQITWTPNLIPGENTIIFDLLLPTKIEEILTFELNVIISRNETTVADTRKSITVEPSVAGQSASGLTGSIPSNQDNFALIFSLVVAMILSAFILLALIAKYLAANNRLNMHMRDLIEMFTIVVIISTLLVLSMVTTIGENAAIGILSGIAGYVLGSRATRSTEEETGQDRGQFSGVVPGAPGSGGKPAPIAQPPAPLEGQSQAEILDLVQQRMQDALKDLLPDGEKLSRETLMDAGRTAVGKIKDVVEDSLQGSGVVVEEEENQTPSASSEKEPPRET